MSPIGTGTLTLDGKDVSGFVRGHTIVAVAGEPTRVTLDLAYGVDVGCVMQGALVSLAQDGWDLAARFARRCADDKTDMADGVVGAHRARLEAQAIALRQFADACEARAEQGDSDAVD